MNTFFIVLSILILFLIFRRFLSPRRLSSPFPEIPPFNPTTLQGPWKSCFAAVNGINLHYVIGGEQNQKLVLFLHGFPEFWYSWRYQLREFYSDYKVVAVDLRGYNDSDKPQSCAAYHLDNIAADVKDFLNFLGHKKCILVGHDWGGVVAWYFTLQYPSFIEKLVVINAPHLGAQRFTLKQLRRSWYVFFFQLPCLPELYMRRNNFRTFVAIFWGRVMGLKNRKNVTLEDIAAYKNAFEKPGALTAAINYYRNLVWTRWQVWRRKIPAEIPVMVLWGLDDAALGPELFEQMPSVAENIKIFTFENCSHWTQMDVPDHVNAKLRDFFREENNVLST
jgi:pimeloyl-ACP methyl ester carboxylesterase